MSKPKTAVPSLSPSKEIMELKSLKRQRTVAKNSIVRIKTGLLDKTMSLDPIELECRLDILNSHSDKLMKCQSKIEEIDEEDIARGELEDLIVETKSVIKSILARNKSSIAESSFVAPHSSRLPKMSLPKFKGEYSEFKNFMSLFESLVHNDPTIPDIEKFNHLVNCLSGEALGTPSALSLRTMIDTVSAVYDSLLSLGDEKNITNAIIIHLVMSKVDTVTRSKWEEQLDYDKLPLWRECEAALNKRYQHLSADEASTSRLKPSSSHSIQKPHLHAGRTKAALVTSNIKQPVCPHCKSNDHSIPACPTFKTLSAQQRFEFAKSVPLCINCLRKGHSVSKCKADRCRVCNRSHHTLLHQYPVSFATAPQLSTSHAMHTTSTPDRVMLATAVVNVKGSSGEYLAARALLDSGSQVNFMTEDLAQKLRIRRESTTLNIIGIGNATKKVRTKLNTFVKSRVNNDEFSAQFWIMRSISASHPDRNVNINGWKIPKNISLADPEFYKAQKVDLLLGAETFFELLAVGQIKASSNHPTLQKTLLGWVVSGKYASNQRPPPTVSSTLCHTEQDLANIDSIVQRFWAMEEIPSGASSTKFTPEQIECEKFFVKTTKVLPSGRLQVRLPFKDDRKLLGNSYETASRRFQALERKTLKDPELRQMYLDFMNEYIELGHMSPTNNKIPSEPHYFIPHQCVLRPESTTTKLRVVFDASSRTSSQIALNEILMVGPTIQEELFIGRRGMPRKIYSDNATNFVGADRKLRELRDAFEAQQPEVQKYATDEGFTFAFIPPRAPHFGGLWEAAVKSAKHLLVRAIGNALLTAEELQTLLVEVEAVLNSRPLVPLSQDPNDGEALTPAHLLVGCPLRALPPAQVSMDPMRCCDRWQLVCCLKQQFWRLWSRNYLLGLQQRNKWLHPKRNLELNDLVLVQEDNTPPQQWVLGRVAAIVTGQDGKVRVADVATKAGVIKRPVHKLAVLPSDVEGP
ncbi:uncharacterized protein LOC128870082 [Anastrepha ludens]|uniref:uncharacterized protein LOC128870082 n=2 Tax=Anastrepha ludens TaxID=28586 RepID=UPI0023B08BCE|nr:uncharacterized protein LOC128870082 [Anastrepha ludens]